jgi:hypothetical protein
MQASPQYLSGRKIFRTNGFEEN